MNENKWMELVKAAPIWEDLDIGQGESGKK